MLLECAVYYALCVVAQHRLETNLQTLRSFD